MDFEDDFLDEDRLVVKTPGGAAAVLPRSARRLKGDALEVFADLQKIGLTIRRLEHELETDLVPSARDVGISWSLIGVALGLTGEGARVRFPVDQDDAR